MTTSSPTSSSTALPSASKASAATPKARVWISPAYTGATGQPDREGGADVRAAADRGQQQVGVVRRRDGVVDPGEALRRQRSPGRAERADLARVRDVPRDDAGVLAGGEVRRAGAEAGDVGAVGQPPQRAEIRVAGAAVEQYDRRARRAAR